MFNKVIVDQQDKETETRVDKFIPWLLLQLMFHWSFNTGKKCEIKLVIFAFLSLSSEINIKHINIIIGIIFVPHITMNIISFIIRIKGLLRLSQLNINFTYQPGWKWSPSFNILVIPTIHSKTIPFSFKHFGQAILSHNTRNKFSAFIQHLALHTGSPPFPQQDTQHYGTMRLLRNSFVGGINLPCNGVLPGIISMSY